jgi:hypothetical protein
MAKKERDEYPAETLPLKESGSKTNAHLHREVIKKLLRLGIVKIIDGRPSEIDVDLDIYIEKIWQEGYSAGIADADRLINEISKKKP